MESKQEICDLLLPVLQVTQDLHDLVSLTYVHDEEYVYAKFARGQSYEICVVEESGTEMILKIIDEIV